VTDLRPPTPLGLLAQAVASGAFGALQLHWIDGAQRHELSLALLVSTVPALGLVSATAWLTGQPGASTGSGLLAGGWAATCLVGLGAPPGSTSAGLGVMLVGVGIALAVPGWGSSATALHIVLAANAARFVVAGVAELASTSAWLHVSGWCGLGVALVSTVGAVAVQRQIGPDTVG
jgi:hypothetical protein